MIESHKPPENFTNSILSDLIDEPAYSYEYFLKPKLSESNLNFKNLYWELKDNKVLIKKIFHILHNLKLKLFFRLEINWFHFKNCLSFINV
jgi:hypothetical protein